ncbi:helix-turn-helix domain-containing protein [Williamsia muralis]|uniref:helix-turn-helix domain-containing protein n=1 Tax=Williamsia marianensis TaxID=85044 RepID=UPI001057C624|nr:helix-turn-helix domain-containing protein [Williamsia marianensis]
MARPRTPDQTSEPVFKNTDEAAELLRMHPDTLKRLRYSGGGPRYVKPGAKVLYRLDDLLEWVEAGARK